MSGGDRGDPGVRTAVLVTATEPEPRSFGKQVVLGGLLDHLCRRLGPHAVHVVLIGPDQPRPPTAYALHLVPRPGPVDQLGAVLTRTLLPPHRPLQEAALWSRRVRDDLERLLRAVGADLEIWDTMRTGQYARAMPPGRCRRGTGCSTPTTCSPCVTPACARSSAPAPAWRTRSASSAGSCPAPRGG